VNLVLTGIEVFGLLLIVAIGGAALGEGSGDFSRNFEFKEGESVFAAIVGGTALAFYAMIAFEDSVNVAEETKRPSRSFPRALFIGIAIAGTLYLLVTLTTSFVVPTGRLLGSDAPLLEVVEEGPLGLSTKLFAFIALMAVANSALINMIMASRIVYGMAARGSWRGFRTDPSRSAHAGGGDRLHHPDRDRPDLDRRPLNARRHDGRAAPVRLHDRQRRRAGAAPRTDRARAFPRALGVPGTLAVGVALWVVNRLVAGPAEEVEVERLRG
jgi:Amino acid permease